MKEEEKNKIINHMNQIGKLVDSGLDADSQKRENTMYFKDFEFGNSGLAIKMCILWKSSRKFKRKLQIIQKKMQTKKKKKII